MADMSIVDDYTAIAAELRRLKGEKLPADNSTDTPREPSPHRMRATIAGELLYRRLVLQNRKGNPSDRRNEIPGMIVGANSQVAARPYGCRCGARSTAPSRGLAQPSADRH
jgi:hypothetical protein